MDTLIRKIFFSIMKIDNFWGDLSDVSAKKGPLPTHFKRLSTLMSVPSDQKSISEQYLAEISVDHPKNYFV